MKVSIVTPTLAFDQPLREARASVERQTRDVEIEHIIVVDDPSVAMMPDEKRSNVSTYFVRNMHPKGPGGARNTALDLATGEFVFFLDADDIWNDEHIAQIMSIFAAQPDVHCVSVAGVSFGQDVSRPRVNIPVLSDGAIPRISVAWNPVGCPSGFSYRRDAKTRAVRFKDAIYFQDLLFYLELLSHDAIFWRHRELHFWYRKSPGQLTSVISTDKVRHSKQLVEHCLAKWQGAGLSTFEAQVASVQIKRLSAARIGRRDYANTLLLCIIAPVWVIGQARRMLENFRIGRNEPSHHPSENPSLGTGS
ncbi:glycosyltransferase family A protein (plasmid) [Novosphingobium sp. BL-8A]|uniref:glycosyltransferase family 2 protein n=1 Tax=Novosphingobium sp. BL-8A TaxID=3127639 RepID=UPI0037572827